jgi:hypothetical protein
MENNVIVNIDAKLYNNIVSYCEANAINPVKYIEKALRERLATDKYGDLNERLAKNTQREIDDVAPESETHIVSHETELVETEPPVVKAVEKIDEKHIETASDTSEESGVEENTIKKKRMLKSK